MCTWRVGRHLGRHTRAAAGWRAGGRAGGRKGRRAGGGASGREHEVSIYPNSGARCMHACPLCANPPDGCGDPAAQLHAILGTRIPHRPHRRLQRLKLLVGAAINRRLSRWPGGGDQRCARVRCGLRGGGAGQRGSARWQGAGQPVRQRMHHAHPQRGHICLEAPARPALPAHVPCLAPGLGRSQGCPQAGAPRRSPPATSLP